jgi:GT2 family glycosyltransferase
VVVLVLITKNRLDFLKRTVDALSTSELADTVVLAVDNGSTDGSREYVSKHPLFTYVFKNDDGAPQWQKSYGICQAQKYALKHHSKFTHFGWIDDDIVVEPDWLQAGKRILAEIPKVTVASMHNDERQEKRHKTIRMQHLGNLAVHIKQSANGAVWLVRRGFFNKFGLPPVDGRSVMQCLKDDDTYNKRLKGKGLFGVVNKSKHIGYKNSQRRKEMHRR